jgi:hypothetical protein
MTMLLVEPERDVRSGCEDGGGATLDELLSGAWEGLSAAAIPAPACPVCQGALVARWSAGAGVVGGRCRDCGSELG